MTSYANTVNCSLMPLNQHASIPVECVEVRIFLSAMPYLSRQSAKQNVHFENLGGRIAPEVIVSNGRYHS